MFIVGNLERFIEIFREKIGNKNNFEFDAEIKWCQKSEMEGLFEVEKITKIEIDSTIVPKELEVVARRK